MKTETGYVLIDEHNVGNPSKKKSPKILELFFLDIQHQNVVMVNCNLNIYTLFFLLFLPKYSEAEEQILPERRVSC